jgi:hypothetical protein
MPDLIVIFGPPAAGKAAIGHLLAERLGYRFFHNHLTADPAAALFGWTTPQFAEAVDEMRDLLFRKAAADPAIPGVVFTFVWGLDLPDDTALMEKAAGLFSAGAGRVFFVELLASLDARIAREGTPFRVRLKPNQADVAAARARQLEFASQYRMNTDGRLPIAYPHITIDTEAMTPPAAAAEIQRQLGLGNSGS